MNLYLKGFIILLSLTMAFSSHSAEPHENLQVNPNIDQSFYIDLETIDVGDVIVDPKAWYHLTEDDIGYLRIQYSIINDSEETMFGHKWTVKVEGEEFSEEVIALLKPGQSKVFSQLLFAGSIQNANNNLGIISLNVTTNTNSIFQMGGNRNNTSCPPYVARCQTPQMVAAVAQATPMCNGRCIARGGGVAACRTALPYKLNGKICYRDTIVCVCGSGNNPESALGLPEISRDRDLGPYIRDVFQNESPLHSRPFDTVE